MTCKQFIFQKLLPFLAKPICLGAVIAQALILDYFLISHTSWDIISRQIEPANKSNASIDEMLRSPAHYAWYLWVIPDIAVVILFIVSFIKSCKHYKKSKKDQNKSIGIGGELPMGYVTWFFYSILTAVKIALIFRWTAQTLDEKSVLGPNLLKIGISLAGVVFLTLVLTHHDADENDTARLGFVNLIQHSVTTDILDTTEILQVILIQESHVFLSFALHRALIAVACMNIILPTVLLIGLSKSRFGKSVKWQKYLTVIHKVFYVALVNIPLLVLRCVIWKTHKKTISVFLIKNSIALGIVVRTVALHIESAVIAAEVEKSQPETLELNPVGPSDQYSSPEPVETVAAISNDSSAAVEIQPSSEMDVKDPKTTRFI